ncbi:MAG: RDD family protein, partial [Actinomycetota bacterium]
MAEGRGDPFFDTVSIATPEGIELELTLAGLGSRFAARLLDDLIRGGVLVVLVILYAATGLPLAVLARADRGISVAQAAISIFFVIALFLLLFGYDIAFEVWGSGRSPGKRATGLRVVETDGGPVGFRASAVRNLVRIIDAIPPGVVGLYGVALVSVLVSRRNQRLGDLAAGTLVVMERRGASPRRVALRPAHPEGEPSLAGWDVSAVTLEELATVRQFLERR